MSAGTEIARYILRSCLRGRICHSPTDTAETMRDYRPIRPFHSSSMRPGVMCNSGSAISCKKMRETYVRPLAMNVSYHLLRQGLSARFFSSFSSFLECLRLPGTFHGMFRPFLFLFSSFAFHRSCLRRLCSSKRVDLLGCVYKRSPRANDTISRVCLSSRGIILSESHFPSSFTSATLPRTSRRRRGVGKSRGIVGFSRELVNLPRPRDYTPLDLRAYFLLGPVIYIKIPLSRVKILSHFHRAVSDRNARVNAARSRLQAFLHSNSLMRYHFLFLVATHRAFSLS